MNKAIVIGTYHGREMWLKDCLASLPYETLQIPIISVAIPWELNVIKWVYDHTNIDEFLFLQDTIVVKDHEWIYDLFAYEGSISLSVDPSYFMYLGKYERRILDKVDFPHVVNKRQAVTYEGEWTNRYVMASDFGVIGGLWDLSDTENYEFRHGRNNKVIENDHIIKYKGTWSPEMIK